MKKLITLSLLFFTLIAITYCSDDDATGVALSGDFMEQSPVIGRSTMRFSDGDSVEIVDNQSTSSQHFTFVLSDGKMTLTNISDATDIRELTFRSLSKNRYRIDGLYQTIQPESLIFEKMEFTNQ